MPNIMTLDHAYRPRKGEDDDKIPHDFVFRCRDRSFEKNQMSDMFCCKILKRLNGCEPLVAT